MRRSLPERTKDKWEPSHSSLPPSHPARTRAPQKISPSLTRKSLTQIPPPSERSKSHITIARTHPSTPG
eukprot:gene18029-24442_t